MNRILFLLTKVNIDTEYAILKDKLQGAGYEVELIQDEKAFSVVSPKEGCLIVTDSESVLSSVKEKGSDVLLYLHDESDIDRYPGGKYFVLDAPECDSDYFLKIYERINNLPWEMYKTEHLTVRETTEDDVDIFVREYKDPQIVKFMEPLYDVENEKKYAREYRDRVYACQEFGMWTLVETKTGNIVGRGGLNFRSCFDEIEIGFVIWKDYRGLGYATEAIESFLSFAEEKELGRVIALVVPGNIASQNVLKKCGFKYVDEVNAEGTTYSLFSCEGRKM